MLPGFPKVSGNTAANSPSTPGCRKMHSYTMRSFRKQLWRETSECALPSVHDDRTVLILQPLPSYKCRRPWPERLPGLLVSETWVACIHPWAPASANSVPPLGTGPPPPPWYFLIDSMMLNVPLAPAY